MRYVVTGGAGFVGVHLLPMLQQNQQHEIHVIDNLGPTSNPEFFDGGHLLPGVTLHQTDINDTAAVESIVAGADAVIHLAAESFVDRSIDDPALFSRVNVEGTVSLLTAA